MLVLILLCALAGSPQDDDAARQRIRKLVEFLEGVLPDSRTQALKELGDLPVRFAPYLRELAAGQGNAEVRATLERMAIPSPWHEFLSGTLNEAAPLIEAIRGAEGQARTKAVARVINAISRRPEGDIRRWTEIFLADAEPRFRDFGLHLCRRWPPADTAHLRALLKDPTLCRRAAEALISAGDDGAVPAALEAYVSSDRSLFNSAATLLRAFGVDEADAEKFASALRKEKSQIYLDLPTLGPRAGQKGIEALIDLCRDGDPRTTPHAMEVVAWMVGEEALPIINSWRDALPEDRKGRALVPATLRDPGMALAWFESLGPEPSITALVEGRRIAWHAGSALRDPILERFKDRTARLSLKRELITMLGVAGRAEDVPFLVECLADARLVEAAAEALEKVGDRSQGKEVMRAFVRLSQGPAVAMALVALDVDGPEEDLVELLSDPDAYGSHAVMAVRLAGRSLTPRLRDLALEKYPKWGEHMQRAFERMILDPARASDADLVARLRDSGDPDLQSLGHHLAMLNGDASRAGRAAKGARVKGISRHWQMGGFRLDRGVEGTAWTEAVTAEWRLSPDWHEAAVWLAARGVKDAMDKVRSRLATETGSQVLPMMAALAAGGDEQQLEALWERAILVGLSREEDDVLLALARRGDKTAMARILALMRNEMVTSAGAGHRLAARLALPEALPAFRLAVTRCDQGYYGGGRQFDLAACLGALARLQDKASIAAIRRHVRSGAEVVRVAAMDALADLGDRGAVPIIVRFIDDPTDTTRSSAGGWYYDSPPLRRVWHHAMDALEKITGEKPPAGSVLQRREFWRAWWDKNRATWK